MPEKKKSSGRIKRAAKAGKTSGVSALMAGAVLVLIGLTFGPGETIGTAGVGIWNDVLFVPMGVAGLALGLYGFYKLVGKN